jgi:hypothetical protein
MINECFKCKGKFFNRELNICEDLKLYVNKDNHFEVVCRYNKDAIAWDKIK